MGTNLGIGGSISLLRISYRDSSLNKLESQLYRILREREI